MYNLNSPQARRRYIIELV